LLHSDTHHLHSTLPSACSLATEFQMWGVALLTARLLGDPAVAQTAAAMTRTCLAASSPLRTLCLQLAGGSETALPQTPSASQQPGATVVSGASGPPSNQGGVLLAGAEPGLRVRKALHGKAEQSIAQHSTI
jgi:hypothetical protein